MIDILIWLFVKHWYIDFVNQSRIEIREKGIYLKKHGINHSLKHGLFTILILLMFPEVDIVSCYIFGLVDFVVHYHIDWAKVQLNNRFNLTVNDRPFWILLGFDQLLHTLTYICMVQVIYA